MGKRKNFTKNVYYDFFFFQLLKYQNVKTHEQLSIWRNITTLPKTCILSIFYIVRFQNAKMDARPLIWGNEITLKETYVLGVFVHVSQRNAKKQGNLPRWKKKKTLTKTSLLSLSFVPKAKKNAKQILQRNRITLPKTSIFSVFEVVTQKNAKIYAKYPVWLKEKTLRGVCVMSVFELLMN